MLPEPLRLHVSADFTSVMRGGRRSGRRDVVVHARFRRDAETLTSPPGPRFGLIVSKAVGPAVTRHRVARRLRHICGRLLPSVAPNVDVVLRALPGSSASSSAELERQIRSALSSLKATSPGAA